MAKGKYEKWLEPENLLLLESWARNGLTDEQIAKNMGINVATLYRYKQTYCEICEALKKGKEIIDFEVENALLKKALGISKTVKKPIKVKEVIYENGRKLKEIERIEYADEEIYTPPETAAIIFWLKNRRPDLWREKQSLVLSGNVDTNNPFEGLSYEQLVKLAELGDAE